MVVHKTFEQDKDILIWLANSKNMEKLKNKYTPILYSAKLNIVDKRIEIHNRA